MLSTGDSDALKKSILGNVGWEATCSDHSRAVTAFDSEFKVVSFFRGPPFKLMFRSKRPRLVVDELVARCARKARLHALSITHIGSQDYLVELVGHA